MPESKPPPAQAGSTLTRENVPRLLVLSTSPGGAGREAAVDLLLATDGPDELPWRLLMDVLSDSPPQVRPRIVLETLCEFLAGSDAPSNAPEDGKRIERFTGALPRRFVRLLFERCFPLQPFLKLMTPGQLPAGPSETGSIKELRRHWRIFRRRVLHLPASPAWSGICLGDLLPAITLSLRKGGRGFSGPRWRMLARPVLFRAAVAPGPPRPNFRESHLRGVFRNIGLHNFARLLDFQARELDGVRDLAHRVSIETGRVVLSWHNATLAAAGGWAFRPVRAQFPSDGAWMDFEAAVRNRLEAFRRGRPDLSEHARRLSEVRRRRLFLPKARHLLGWWRSRYGAWEPSAAGLEALERVLSVFTPDERRRMEESIGHLSFREVVRPHQEIPIEDLLHETSNEAAAAWAEGFLTLAAMAVEGDRLVRRGDLPGLVLPWIDKFYISSLRDRDTAWLPALVEGLVKAGAAPLVLFWEDTARMSAPSFQLGLDLMRAAGHPFRGIGIFDSGSSSRSDALRIILEEHGAFSLFALKPVDGPHNPGALERLLTAEAPGFFDAYDSAWKDNLCFLYAGTRVASLVSVQTSLEAIPGWIGADGVKYPAGAFVRAWLRRRTLAEKEAEAHPLSGLTADYTRWANLD